MTNLERLKYMLNVPEDYDVSDIADFLACLILNTKCESFNDIRQELLDNYNKREVRKTFEVIFNDGNKKLFESSTYEELLLFLMTYDLYKNVIDIKTREDIIVDRKRGKKNEQ